LPRDVGVVVVAAGRSTRLGAGGPKQYQPVAGVPMVLRALRPFAAHPEVAQVVLVLPPADAAAPPEFLRRLTGAGLLVVAGGPERSDSVAAGLAALASACTTVLVHDAARPFVDRPVIDAVIARARAGEGAVAAVLVSDTLKEASPEDPSLVGRTVPRDGLWRAQTPQGFPREMLRDAYAQLGGRTANGGAPPPSDDAEVCERAGFPVELIPDSPYNFKITTPDDFRIAEALARELR